MRKTTELMWKGRCSHWSNISHLLSFTQDTKLIYPVSLAIVAVLFESIRIWFKSNLLAKPFVSLANQISLS